MSNRIVDCNLLLICPSSSYSGTRQKYDVIINYEDIPSFLIELALNQLFVYEEGQSDNCNGIVAILKYVKESLVTIHFAMENHLSSIYFVGEMGESPRTMMDIDWRVDQLICYTHFRNVIYKLQTAHHQLVVQQANFPLSLLYFMLSSLL